MSSPRYQLAVFLFAVLATYGSLHAYLWWKTVRQLRVHGSLAAAVALFFCVMVALPFLGRLLRDGSSLLRGVELVTFLWMGLAFYLFLLNLGADVWNGASWGLSHAAPPLRIPRLGGQRLFLGVLLLAASIVAYAAVEASRIRLVTHTIPTAKLPAGAAPVRIVQVSDIHLGMLLGEGRLRTILAHIREARPDLLVATGDVLDAVGYHLDPLAEVLRSVSAPLGKFAVTGNHEYYTGIQDAVAFLRAAGFRVLRDETAVIPGLLNVVGEEYRSQRGSEGSPARRRPLAGLVREGDPALFTLLLRHLPVRFAEETAPAGVDLQLSGHTHDGQLFPFRYLVRLSFPRMAGFFREGESLLYVSRGTGTWGPPLRFLAPPEVTLFILTPAAASGTPAAPPSP